MKLYIKAIRRIIVLAILIVTNFVLQSTIFGFHSVHGITPNLLLILTMSFGLMRGRKEGLLVGFFSGLLVDAFFGALIGPYMLIYMLIGYFNGSFHKNYMVEDVLLPVIAIIIDDFVYNLLVYFFFFMLANRMEFGSYFIGIILPEIVVTALITVIVYKPYVLINRMLKR